ncbi:hypothetical protein B0H34DRAFT_94971 [Crassisporium funariophilum]|nr:hypothetical protein B0H34DRAFT_94971 [Crassisporium funariophilum]
MSTEESRRVAIEWAACVAEGRYDDLDALAAPDATWWISGLQSKIPYAGLLPFTARRAHIREIFKDATSLVVDVVGVTAEGDTAVLEAAPRAESGDGKVYENNLLIKFVVRDGKIRSVREYIDFFAIFKFMGVEV